MGKNTGMLLNILQCSDVPPPQKKTPNYPDQNVIGPQWETMLCTKYVYGAVPVTKIDEKSLYRVVNGLKEITV